MSALSILPGRRPLARLNASSKFYSGMSLAFVSHNITSGAAIDISPNGRHGIATLGAIQTHSFGLPHHHTAWHFGGTTGSFLRTPAPYAYEPSTFAFVCKTAQQAYNQYLVVHNPALSVTEGIGVFRFANTQALGGVNFGIGSESFPECTWPDNEWTFIGMQWPSSPTAVRAYSGSMTGGGGFHVEVDASNINGTAPAGTPAIVGIGGGDGWGVQSLGPGQIAAAFRWSRAVPDDEMREFWIEARNGFPTIIARDSPYFLIHSAAAPAGGIRGHIIGSGMGCPVLGSGA